MKINKLTKYLIYLILLGLIYVASIRYFNPNCETARTFLSTIAQSQAAIIGITVSILLICIQVIYQGYSSRVLNILIGRKIFSLTTSVFVFSILLDLFFLGSIPEKFCMESDVLYMMSITSVMTILSLLFLIEFISDIPKLLDTQNFPKLVIAELKKEYLGLKKKLEIYLQKM